MSQIPRPTMRSLCDPTAGGEARLIVVDKSHGPELWAANAAAPRHAATSTRTLSGGRLVEEFRHYPIPIDRFIVG